MEHFSNSSSFKKSAAQKSKTEHVSFCPMHNATENIGLGTTSKRCCCPQNYPTRCNAMSDNEDNLSFSSLNSRNSRNSKANNREVDPFTQVSVRDMIKRFNSAIKTSMPKMSFSTNNSPRKRHSSHSLIKSKSSFHGLNRFGSQTNLRSECLHKIEHKNSDTGVNSHRGYCTFCQNELMEATQNIKAAYSKGKQRFSKLHNPNVLEKESLITDTKTGFITKNANERTYLCLKIPKVGDSSGIETTDANTEAPTESTYSSRTTITKMPAGVRIIIDIFFDQQQEGNQKNYNVLGSQIETNIPQSRILQEFQEYESNLNSSLNIDNNTNTSSLNNNSDTNNDKINNSDNNNDNINNNNDNDNDNDNINNNNDNINNNIISCINHMNLINFSDCGLNNNNVQRKNISKDIYLDDDIDDDFP